MNDMLGQPCRIGYAGPALVAQHVIGEEIGYAEQAQASKGRQTSVKRRPQGAEADRV